VASSKLDANAGTALLGLILERHTSYGWELVNRFERVFGTEPLGWSVSSQAIYRALARLEDHGLIEQLGPEPARRGQEASRRNYRGTPVGARAMRTFLSAAMPSVPSRQELLIRLYFSESRDDALRDQLRLHAEECLEELERIARLPARTRLERIVKEDRRLAVQARLSWIDFVRAEMREPGEGPIRELE